MTAIILVLIVIAMIFMAVLAWGLCAAAGDAQGDCGRTGNGTGAGKELVVQP